LADTAIPFDTLHSTPGLEMFTAAKLSCVVCLATGACVQDSNERCTELLQKDDVLVQRTAQLVRVGLTGSQAPQSRPSAGSPRPSPRRVPGPPAQPTPAPRPSASVGSPRTAPRSNRSGTTLSTNSTDDGTTTSEGSTENVTTSVGAEGDTADAEGDSDTAAAEGDGDTANAEADSDANGEGDDVNANDAGEESSDEGAAARAGTSIGSVQDRLKEGQEKLETEGNQGKAAIAEASGEGGFHDGGGKWGVEELVRRNGLLRGVYLLADASPGFKREVLEFTEVALANEGILEMKVLLTPDTKTTEGSVESSSSLAVQTTNSMIDSYGTSAFQSSSVSAGLGGSAGVASFGLSFGSSDSKDDASSSDQSQTQKMAQASNSYTKSKYYFEPRSVLVADPEVLKPTEQFTAALARLKSGAGGYTVSDLFADFGTHTCTTVMLGGWWRITANYVSTTKKSGTEMSKVTSTAISSISSSSFGVTAGATNPSGASVEANVGTSSEDKRSTDTAVGQSSTDASSSETTNTDLYQEWKGGASGGTEQEWRASLDPEKNSNWRIIDRNVDSCRGIWQWVEGDQTLKQRICEGWKQKFVSIMGISGKDAAAAGGCEGNANMQEFRKIIAELKAKQDQDELNSEFSACEKKEGYHFEDAKCKENVCVCGAEVGLTGLECPEHGAVGCKESQKADCSRYMCPTRFVSKLGLNPSDAKCAANICNDVDRDICCDDVRKSDKFLLTIRTENGRSCGTDQDVLVKVNGQGKTTGWQALDKEGYNDFEQGDITDYTVTAPEAFIAEGVCLKSSGWCVTADQPGVTVYNANLAKGAKSKIGDVSNFNDFDDSEVEQCMPIIMP